MVGMDIKTVIHLPALAHENAVMNRGKPCLPGKIFKERMECLAKIRRVLHLPRNVVDKPGHG